MADSLARLFDHGGDFALCDRLFVRICATRGNGADASTLPVEERTVYLAWGSLGVIGNGGFRLLFESEIQGDPDYRLTRQAFEAIGCLEAAEASIGGLPQRSPPGPSGQAAPRVSEERPVVPHGGRSGLLRRQGFDRQLAGRLGTIAAACAHAPGVEDARPGASAAPASSRRLCYDRWSPGRRGSSPIRRSRRALRETPLLRGPLMPMPGSAGVP